MLQNCQPPLIPILLHLLLVVMLLIIWAQLCTVIPLVIYFFLTTAFMYVTMSISTSSAYICMYVLNISMEDEEDEHYKRALLLYRGAGNLPNPNDRPIVTQSMSRHDHQHYHGLHFPLPLSDLCRLFAIWLFNVDLFSGLIYLVKVFSSTEYTSSTNHTMSH